MTKTPANKNVSPSYARLLRTIAFLPLVAALHGCVTKSTYDRDVSTLADALERERGQSSARIGDLETKLFGRGKSMTELTQRYSALQKERERAQMKLNRFRDDLEGLLRDVEQLKLMVYANAKAMKGSSGSEMLIKLTQMEILLKEMLDKELSLTAPPPPSDNLPAPTPK